MPSFSNLDARRGAKSLTVKPIQQTTQRRWDCATSIPVLCRLLALVLALTVAPAVVFAQEWDHVNGRDKANDPTGAWLIRNSGGQFILTVFHKGGTLTGDVQGESAFVPGVKPPESVINSPESGVWQKTGWKTFAATFITLEYDANPPFALFQFDKIQFTGVLNESGDQSDLTALVTLFNLDGTQKPPKEGIRDKANGIRIPLQILPSTAHSLPIPPPSPSTQSLTTVQ